MYDKMSPMFQGPQTPNAPLGQHTFANGKGVPACGIAAACVIRTKQESMTENPSIPGL